MAPVLQVFGIAIQTYPLAILIAAAGGLWLAARTAQDLATDGSRVYDLGFYALLATALGARLTYVVIHLSAYAEAPLSALSLTPTALSWPGGAAIGLLVALMYGRRHRMLPEVTLDALAPGAALALAIERVGAFLGGIGLGAPTTSPWGIDLWGQVRHPLQVYEALTLLVILAALWRRRTDRPLDGHLFALFVFLYAASRLFLEAYREQTPLILGGVRAVQVAALAIMLGCLGYLYYRQFHGQEPPQD